MVDDAERETEEYLDRMFGPGAGRKHVRFLEHLESPALRGLLHRFHGIEADTTHLSHEENYLIALCVLCATGNFATAAMFAKTLRHIGTKKEKIIEAVGRLGMWIGGPPAAEASARIQRALADYDNRGQASLEAWFPSEERR
jgi:hypothetical protein